jgi:hypothetical protein
MASLRLLLAIAAAEDLEIQQMDFIAAFLAGELEEEIYMEQPEGFSDGTDRVCLLNKSLYGLKQAARVWNQRIRKFLKDIGFTQTHADHCVYVNKDTGIILAMWVDDLLIFGKNMDQINELKAQLQGQFEMKDLGDLKYFLGIHVTRNREERSLTISQSAYIHQILERFRMKNCKPADTPMAAGCKLTKAAVGDLLVDEKEYQSLVGSLMYAMTGTRPDLAYTVSQLSQYNAKPTAIHLTTAKRVLRYLKGHTDLGITYGNNDDSLNGYCDADWGANEDRKSISGYLFMLGGGAISWSSKKQSTVALSSTEAEYIALMEATKESIWLQRLLSELGRADRDHRIMWEDNQGAIALALNPEYHA